MFKIEKYKVNGDARNVAQTMIRAQGEIRYLGSGIYGRVYGCKTNGLVYKTGEVDGNDGYLAYIKVLSKQNTHNPYLPKIYGVRFIKGDSGRGVFVVAMEKLSELRDSSAVDWIRNAVGDGGRHSNESARLWGVKGKTPRELDEAIKVLKKAHRKAVSAGADWDLHSGNIMQRGRQLVITDPLA